MFDPVIRAKRLTRYFGSHAVIRDLDFEIPRGQVTALLGLNGAGKTTTIRIIMGLLRPTRGQCELLGESTSELSIDVRRRVGYLVEGHFLYPGMRVDQCARFQRPGYTRWDDKLFDQIVDHFGISQRSRIAELSRGQRAGVALALVLAPDPEILVMDDPALGLDPISRRALNETLVEFVSHPERTVLLSTHLLDDVERIADRVMTMIGGRLVVDTSMADFTERVTGFEFASRQVDPNLLAAVPGLVEARRIGDRLHLVVTDADEETRAALSRLSGTAFEPTELSFSDSVLAFLARQRNGSSFLSTNRKSISGV